MGKLNELINKRLKQAAEVYVLYVTRAGDHWLFGPLSM